MQWSFFLFLFLCARICAFADGYSLFEQNGKVGLKNQQGEVVITPQYEALGWSNGSFSVKRNVVGYKLNGRWGIINVTNQRITAPDFTVLTPAEGNLIVAGKSTVLLQMKTGCITTEGKTVIPFHYAGITIHAMRAVAFVREGNLFKHGLIDLENKIIIPFQYKSIYPIGSLRYAVEDFSNKTALFSEGGRQLTGFSIDSLSTFTNNLAILYEGGKMGLINREGQLRSEAKFRSIELLPEKIRTRMPDEWSILTADNRSLDTVEADAITSLTTQQYKIEVAGSSWVTTRDFKKLHEAGYERIDDFKNGFAVFKAGSRVGVLRKNGTMLLKPVYRRVFPADNYFLVEDKNSDGQWKWFLVDSTGVKRNTKAYDIMLTKLGDVYPVKKNGFWGAIDDYGKEIIACVYDSLLEARFNQVNVKFRGQHGIISLKEEWLVLPQTSKLQLLNQDRYFKIKDSTLFLCSFNGMILYFTNNPVKVEGDFLIERVSAGGTWVLDFDGRIIKRELPPQAPADEIFDSSEGLRGIKKDGRYGFIDDRGRLRIANRYEGIQSFSEGLAAVKIRNKWGFINRDEKLMIQPVYDAVTPFLNGFSVVKQNNKFGLLTSTGELVLPVRYSSFQILNNGRIVVEQNDLKGLSDANGNLLLQPKYNYLEDLNNGYVIVGQDDFFGLVTLQGISTIPMQFNALRYDRERNRYLALKRASWVEMPY